MLPGTLLSLEFEMEPEGQSLDPTAGANAFASLSPLDRYCPSSHRETRRGELPRTMPVLFEKLTNNTLRGRVAEQIRGAILNGNLAAGQRIVERTIAAEFGASLTWVREAIIQLESEGFITKKPNASTCVTQISLSEQRRFLLCARCWRSLP